MMTHSLSGSSVRGSRLGQLRLRHDFSRRTQPRIRARHVSVARHSNSDVMREGELPGNVGIITNVKTSLLHLPINSILQQRILSSRAVSDDGPEPLEEVLSRCPEVPSVCGEGGVEALPGDLTSFKRMIMI